MTDHLDADIPEPVYVTVSELARREGVARQSMHERIRRLAETHAGLTKREGRSVLVDVALFETALAENGDPVKEAAQETRKLANEDADQTEPVTNHYRDAQTQRAQIDARIKSLELAKMQNQLVPVDGPNGIHAAMRRVAEVVTRRVELLPRLAQRLQDEGLISDQAAVRRILREEVDDLMRKVSADMKTLSLSAQSRQVSIDVDGEELPQ